MKSIFQSAAFIFAAVVMGVSMQSCNTTKSIDKGQLSGYWALKTLDGEKAEDAFKGSLPSLTFDFEKNTVFGNSGCNNYTGGFTLSDKNEFSAPRLAGTLKMCIDANKEPQYLKALGTDKLILSLEKDGSLAFKQGNKTLLEFVKGENPKAKLDPSALSGEWTLKTMAGGDMAKLFGERVPTISFTDGNNISGNSGCNRYRATYKVEGNTLTAGPVITTRMACPNGMEGEQKYTKFFESPLDVKVTSNTLSFSQNGSVVLEYSKVVK